jgi:hypothetical protein
MKKRISGSSSSLLSLATGLQQGPLDMVIHHEEKHGGRPKEAHQIESIAAVRKPAAPKVAKTPTARPIYRGAARGS